MPSPITPSARDVLTHLRWGDTVLLEHCSWSLDADLFLDAAFRAEAELDEALGTVDRPGHLVRVLPYDAPPGSPVEVRAAYAQWLDVVTLSSQLSAPLRIEVQLCTRVTARGRDLLLSSAAAHSRLEALRPTLFPRRSPDWSDTDLRDADPFWMPDVI